LISRALGNLSRRGFRENYAQAHDAAPGFTLKHMPGAAFRLKFTIRHTIFTIRHTAEKSGRCVLHRKVLMALRVAGFRQQFYLQDGSAGNELVR
jgi:hypothetical protein